MHVISSRYGDLPVMEFRDIRTRAKKSFELKGSKYIGSIGTRIGTQKNSR